MKRIYGIVTAALFAATLAGCGAHRVTTAGQFAPNPCPSGETNDLAGLEGWAPGAGKAEKMGQGGVSQFGAFGGALAGGGSSTPSPAPTPSVTCVKGTPLDPNDPLAQLRMPPADFWPSLDTMAGALPQQNFDLDAAAKVLGADVSANYAFVQNSIGLDVYAGSMRGALGTLIAAAGNPTDQAALLSELLKRNGFTVRFARSTLNAAEIAQLEQRATTFVPQPQATPNPDDALKAAGLDANQVQKDLGQWSTAAVNDAKQRAHDAVAAASGMNAQLSKNGATLGSAATLATMQSDALRTHYYVQVQQNGAWTDLDPSSGDKMGQHIGTADATFSAASLPDSESVTVDLKVFADPLTGAPSTQPLAEKSAATADLFGKPVYVTIVPQSNVAESAIDGQTNFVPTIAFGDDATDGTAFSVASLGTPNVALGRVRLEIDVNGPQRKTVYSRILYDRTAPQTPNAAAAAWSDPAKAAQALPLDVGLMVMTGNFNKSFYANALIANIKDLKPQFDGNFARPAFPLDVLRFFSRDRTLRAALITQYGTPVRFVYDRPAIAMDIVSAQSQQPDTTLTERFDIVENTMEAFANDPSTAIQANLARGMLDEAIEQHLKGKDALTTASLLGAVDGNRNDLAVFSAATRANADKLPIPATSMQALDAALAAGHYVVAATSLNQGNFPWWDVDSVTGYAVGRMNDGGGQAMTEYEEEVSDANIFIKSVKYANHFSHFMKCNAEHQGHVGACTADTVCNIAFAQLSDALGDGVFEDLANGSKAGGEAISVGLDMGLGAIDMGPGDHACGALFGTGEGGD